MVLDFRASGALRVEVKGADGKEFAVQFESVMRPAATARVTSPVTATHVPAVDLTSMVSTAPSTEELKEKIEAAMFHSSG